ncbi:hypothetical protein SO802_011391 [Lithocarpus litseifolius]|uniref:Transposase MuDR plant domain-containing protein n=1 Tax=Lithocarpus litseifolius TaxID=425828 RepID=A0AAW2D388_9ROSI
MEEGDLIFEIHHGGRFKNLNGLIYVGGDISIHSEGYDRDCMSFIEVESILKSYGYKRGDLVYYKQVGMNLDEGLVQIKTDPDVLKMVDCHKGVENVVLYTVSQEIDSDCIPFTHNLLESVIVGGSKRKGKEKCVANAGFNRPKLQIKGGKNKSTGSNGKGKEKVCDDVVPIGYDADGDLDVDWHENIAEDEYDSLNESEEEEEFDVENSRAYKDPFWGEVLIGDEDIFEPIGKENDPKKVLYLTHGEQMGKDCGSDIGKSDELISPKPTSDEDNCNTNKNLEFNEIDMACPELVKGLKFGDVATFRAAVREANLIKGKDLRFVKNNKDKVIVRCKAEGCKYRVYGSQVTDEMTFQIKTLNPTHTCTRAYKNSACTSRWISKRYMQKFRYDLNCATAGLQKEIKDKFHVDVGRMQAYEPIIYPVASMEQWRRTSIDPLEPPKDKIQRGRPKIKRKRHPSEPKNPYKLSKAGTIIKCSECKKVGHNSRTCPSKKDKKLETGTSELSMIFIVAVDTMYTTL